MNQIIDMLLNRLKPTLTPDGGDLTLSRVEGNIAIIDYRKGPTACSACVFTDDQLREFLVEALIPRVPGLQDVQVNLLDT